ncbi:uncharacterized protein LOC131667585 [Phymastichus coffea]|uniref:uncharacterized protein LOC131667585 n=1 Tax=Phymastichus coffea TaxID=108790 RepID=UPI00273AE210|nr:uncharacterized protein LOC131667585 [Phymastichus coffea]
MRLVILPALQVMCCILLHTSCVLAVTKIKTPTNHNNEKYANEEIPKNHRKQLKDEIDLDNVFDAVPIKDEQIPILPPIILLDFVNGTDDISNDTLADEKAKRTIDDSLGYGFNRNNLFSGKHNFYFPRGKEATSVSIEESISPFEPKTVAEIEKPITENSDADVAQEIQKSHKPLYEFIPEPLPLMNNRDPLPLYPPFPMFGQRTKLHKTSSSEFNQQFQRPQLKFASSFSATPGSDIYNRLLTTYTSIKPTDQQATPTIFSNPTNIQNYVRPMPSSYVTNYMSDIQGNGNSLKSSYNFLPSPLSSETPVSPQDLASYPKYTIENGIKYEHKIVWKYPDGKVAEIPPTSYINMYSEYISNLAKAGSFRPSQSYQPLPTKYQQSIIPGATSYNTYTPTADNNIYSQKPVQFPNDQDQSSKSVTSGFISSPTMNTPIRQNAAVNSYNLQNYQGQFGLKQHPKVSNYRTASNQYDKYSAYSNNYRPALTNNINSPTTEYSYPAGSQSSENLFMTDGQLNKQVLSKYTPQAQEYLTKVFSSGRTTNKNEYQNDEFKNYANTDYSSLLNYNPSILQYIKNPASILKAQPTFVQAGNSLIPVIILRVDGAPPIQSQSTSNINLKSLLRQYLTQYVNSVSKIPLNANYNSGSNFGSSSVSAPQSNPVQDIKELTETLASLRQRGYQNPYFANNLTSEYIPPPQQTHQQNSEAKQEFTGLHYGSYYQPSYSEQQDKISKKVINVQIVEDPRYTSYKVDN